MEGWRSDYLTQFDNQYVPNRMRKLGRKGDGAVAIHETHWGCRQPSVEEAMNLYSWDVVDTSGD